MVIAYHLINISSKRQGMSSIFRDFNASTFPITCVSGTRKLALRLTLMRTILGIVRNFNQRFPHNNRFFPLNIFSNFYRYLFLCFIIQ